MDEIVLIKRVKYAGDVHAELLKAGWDLDTATAFVNNIPDADVAPVRHGQWLHHYYDNGEQIDDKWYCSECAMCGEYKRSWYCPNCGAKMDGELKEGAGEE